MSHIFQKMAKIHVVQSKKSDISPKIECLRFDAINSNIKCINLRISNTFTWPLATNVFKKPHHVVIHGFSLEIPSIPYESRYDSKGMSHICVNWPVIRMIDVKVHVGVYVGKYLDLFIKKYFFQSTNFQIYFERTSR